MRTTANVQKLAYARHGEIYPFNGSNPATFMYADAAMKDRLGYQLGHLASGDRFGEFTVSVVSAAQVRRVAA